MKETIDQFVARGGVIQKITHDDIANRPLPDIAFNMEKDPEAKTKPIVDDDVRERTIKRHRFTGGKKGANN